MLLSQLRFCYKRGPDFLFVQKNAFLFIWWQYAFHLDGLMQERCNSSNRVSVFLALTHQSVHFYICFLLLFPALFSAVSLWVSQPLAINGSGVCLWWLELMGAGHQLTAGDSPWELTWSQPTQVPFLLKLLYSCKATVGLYCHRPCIEWMEMLPFWQKVLSSAALKVVIEATREKYGGNITWIQKKKNNVTTMGHIVG